MLLITTIESNTAGIKVEYFQGTIFKKVFPLLQPTTECTFERISISYASESTTSPDYADLRARNIPLWKEVFQDDVFVVVGMQRRRNAPGFDGGRFSPVMDAPTHCFYRWLTSRSVG